eukprot:363862-Chlamydomonas_euryale.AAC.22
MDRKLGGGAELDETDAAWTRKLGGGAELDEADAGWTGNSVEVKSLMRQKQHGQETRWRCRA